MNAAPLAAELDRPADPTPSSWPAVLLNKPIAGRAWITLTTTHPDPVRKVRELARACFWATPDAKVAITSVEPEPYDELRKFSPHVIYGVTAYATGV